MSKRWVSLWMMILMVVQPLAAVAHEHTWMDRGESPPIRVVVDGQEVQMAVPPYIDDSNRMLVHSRSIAEAMGLDVRYNRHTREVEIRRYLVPPTYQFLRFWENSPTVEFGIYGGASRGEGPTRFQLDTQARFREIGGYAWLYVPVRIIPDAFNCANEWDGDTWTFTVDCSRPADVHQDLEAVFREHPPELHPDFYYYYPNDEDGIPMYPTTYAALSDYLDPVNRAVSWMWDNPDRAVIHRVPMTDIIAIADADEPNRTVTAIHPTFTAALRDQAELAEIKHLMQLSQQWQGRLAGGVGAGAGVVIGVLVPAGLMWTAVEATLSGVLGYQFAVSSVDDEISLIEACAMQAQVLAARDGQDPLLSRVTLGYDHSGTLYCIPEEMNLLTVTLSDFETKGVGR